MELDRQKLLEKWSEWRTSRLEYKLNYDKHYGKKKDDYVSADDLKEMSFVYSIRMERLADLKRRPYIKGLKRFFYYHQYDEERYPHFRCCDQQIDPENSDEETNDAYLFFD